MIAGLEQPTSGEVWVGGQRVDGIPPRSRNIGFMFQGYALFKHITVEENIGFGLKIKKTPKKERQRRVEELVGLMGLEGLESRKPAQLSGGQQQRVAFARALAPWPRVLLLDEPFGALDAKVRQRLRADTKRWQRELGDRVAILNAGRFEQVDTSSNIYNRPANPFVARFIGRVNVFSARLSENRNPLIPNTEFEIMVRPEDFAVLPWDDQQPLEAGNIAGTIVSHAFLGRTVRQEVQLKNGRPVTVALPKHQALVNDLHPGRPVVLSIGSFHVFPSANGVQDGNGAHPPTELSVKA